MAKVTMTLYEALSKKKILESKVDDLRAFSVCTTKKKNSDETSVGYSTEEFKKMIQSRIDSTRATLCNYTNLKAAINEANARIEVTINGQTYSIANAIARHRAIQKERMIYMSMLRDLEKTENNVNQINADRLSPERISDHVSKILGDSKKDSKLIEAVTDEYKKKYEVELYDPFNMKEFLSEMLDSYDKFEEEIHFALTQANVNNTIEVEFAD